VRSGATFALWLFVINLGIAFGAGMYEQRIVVSRWLTDPARPGVHWNAEAARTDDTGRRFWAFVSTLPLTLLTLANLFFGWRASGAIRGWWLAAACLALADRVFTFSYFIPTMIGLFGAPDSPESASVANRWATLNHVRHAILLAAWIATLQTFALFQRQHDCVGGGLSGATQTAKTEFLAMLAHELRNPLAPILVSIEVLRRAKDNEASDLRNAEGQSATDNRKRPGCG